MNSMDIHEILKNIPHRYPFLLIDKVIELIPGKSITAIKNVSCNEPYFPGHFPQRMVMPGVLILEAMAQASAVLAFKTTNTLPDDGSLYYFAGIENTRFKKVVEPGDQLRLEVKVLKYKRGLWILSGIATVDDTLVCSSEILCSKKDI